MIGFFRSIFQSKIGLFLTFAFIALVALAFASADITGGSFGGVTGNNVASVGGEDIGSGDLSRATSSTFENVRQQNPTLDMATFVDQKGMEGVLGQIINGYALEQFGKKYGMIASKRLVDSEISSINAFHGPDGKFSETAFRQVLQSQKMTENQVREELTRAVIGEQILTPISLGASAPQKLSLPYASLILEGRRGRIAIIPSVAYLPANKPGNQAVSDFYTANTQRYMRPEQRRIRYAVFNADTLGGAIVPTEQEIQAEYKSRAKEFAASETRSITQVILPTEAAAQALESKLRGGQSISAAAQSVGLSASEVNNVGKEKFARDFSNAVADAVFSAPKNALTKPAQSGLGWHIARIDAITAKPARSLEQARSVLTAELRDKKTLQAVADKTESFEDEFASGTTLGEVASAQKLDVKQTPYLVSTGQAPTQPDYRPDEQVQRMLQTAFSMEQGGDPQLVELVPGKSYAMFDVSDIKPAAPPPLADIRDQVTGDYLLDQGSQSAKASAEKVRKMIASGKSLDQALQSLGVALPQVETVGATRAQLASSKEPVPPPMALLFSMAEKTAKVLQAPRDQGWYVVTLDQIDRGDAGKRPELLAQTQQDLGPVIGREYEQQFLSAIKTEVGVKRNESAIKGVGDELSGRGRTN